MTTKLTRETVEDLIRGRMENTFGNHLVFGEILSCEYVDDTDVWEVRFTTRELVWKNDYELIVQRARIDADGYFLELQNVGKTVSALDLYGKDVPAEIVDRVRRSDQHS